MSLPLLPRLSRTPFRGEGLPAVETVRGSRSEGLRVDGLPFNARSGRRPSRVGGTTLGKPTVTRLGRTESEGADPLLLRSAIPARLRMGAWAVASGGCSGDSRLSIWSVPIPRRAGDEDARKREPVPLPLPRPRLLLNLLLAAGADASRELIMPAVVVVAKLQSSPAPSPEVVKWGSPGGRERGLRQLLCHSIAVEATTGERARI
mmetsp:Transcript_14707/g.35063  ORF Transcript_14707/g.35063 Transcript_14707/m.35063 type:complete len:205 (-) Transcript_14707:16-630(-)